MATWLSVQADNSQIDSIAKGTNVTRKRKVPNPLDGIGSIFPLSHMGERHDFSQTDFVTFFWTQLIAADKESEKLFADYKSATGVDLLESTDSDALTGEMSQAFALRYQIDKSNSLDEKLCLAFMVGRIVERIAWRCYERFAANNLKRSISQKAVNGEKRRLAQLTKEQNHEKALRAIASAREAQPHRNETQVIEIAARELRVSPGTLYRWLRKG